MCFFFFKQKTAYEMRISDWSSDVCSSDLLGRMAALSAGYEITVSGVTLDRFCGGGITSVNLAAATVMSGMEDCVVAGGTEMMSYTAQLAAQEANAGIKPLGMGADRKSTRLNSSH